MGKITFLSNFFCFKVLIPVISLIIAQQIMASETGTKPSQKEVLGALMKNLEIKLNDAKHCEGVGVEQTDRTVGDYLSGFWAFHANETGKNWLDISTTSTGKGRYLAKVMIYRKDGEENWGWGVSFELDSSNKVNRGSFGCLGAG